MITTKRRTIISPRRVQSASSVRIPQNIGRSLLPTINITPLKLFSVSSIKLKVVVIYTTAGTHPIQNDYSHGSRFPCQKIYIHGCRASNIKVLFTRQPFLIPKGLYTRLPCIKYKNAIYTAAVSHAKWFLHTAAVHPVYFLNVIYTASVFNEKLIINTAAVPPVCNGYMYLLGSRS